MLVYLSANVRKLSSICADAEHARYGAMTGIHIVGSSSGPYALTATDGRVLVRIQGAYDDLGLGMFDGIPEWDGETIIPKADWDAVFKTLPAKLPSPARPFVGIGAHEGQVILGTNCGLRMERKPADGRFPNCNQVFESHQPAVRLRFNPRLLMDLLQVLAAINPESISLMLPNRDDKPIGLLAEGAHSYDSEGQVADALIVPLVTTSPK